MTASSFATLALIAVSLKTASPSSVPAPLVNVLDRTLSAVEHGGRRASAWRQQLSTTTQRAAPVATVWDAVAIGGLSGWLCGVLLIGRPDVMAVAGISACAFAQQKRPDNRFGRLANRASGAFYTARVTRFGLREKIQRTRQSLKRVS